MTSKGVFVAVVAIALILSMTFMASAIAGKIGNARMVLYPKIGFFGTTIERTILVKNENDVSVNISLRADANFSKIVKIIDSDFVLQPGENKEARFKITIKEEGDYDGKIVVYFTPIDVKEPGVALSSEIIIHARKDSGTDSGDPVSSEDNSDSIDNSINDSSQTVSGSVISMQNFVSNNKAVIAVSVSTLVLAILLIALLYLSKKSRGKIKAKRVKDRNI